jgi:hypothetical protein
LDVVLPRDDIWLPDPVGALRDSAQRAKRWWWKSREQTIRAAIALDATLGGAAIDTAATTIPFTTTNPIASGGFAVLGICCSSTASVSSVSGGGLTWAVDKTGGDGSFTYVLASAQAPSGLAASTVITGNLSASVAGRGICGASLTGVATSSPLDVTSGPTGFATTTWTTASTTILAGSVLFGFSVNVNADARSTPTAPSVEDADLGAGAGTFGFTLAHRIETSAGAYTVAGVWASGTIGSTIAAAYKVSAGPTAAPAVKPRRMPLGV